MNKTIIRGAFTAIAAAAVIGMSAGTASAETSPAATSGATGVSCPAQVPAQPSNGDLINAWNTSGACLGGGAAGLVSSAWAGAIPVLVEGAFFGWQR